MKKTLFIITSILLSITINAQSKFEQFKNYSPFGFSIGVNRLSAPKIYEENKGIIPINAYNPIIGFEYELFATSPVSCFIGFNFTFIPTERFDVYYENIDGMNNDAELNYYLNTKHSKPTLTYPIGVSFKQRITNNLYLAIKSGAELSVHFRNNKDKYSLYNGNSYMSYYHLEDRYNSVNMFGSVGVIYATKPLLIKADLIYSHNFDNIVKEGRYQISYQYLGIAYGKYSSDMSYIGLKLTLVPRKHCKEKKETNN
ncbi:MAG: hypothetical protein PHG98_07100 [Bacteroidales bacterium]|nr:hypothetical protein [Bacteroidales bacterium]MDD4739701.1 hypothetical protein [Bacteroidales bacterium]